MEVDAEKVLALAESAEERAKKLHREYADLHDSTDEETQRRAQNLLNDFFYWSGKATSYRGVVAMAELATIVEDELEAEGSCP